MNDLWYDDADQYVVIATINSSVSMYLPLSDVPYLKEDDLYIITGHTDRLVTKKTAWEELDPEEKQFVKGYCQGFFHGWESGWESGWS